MKKIIALILSIAMVMPVTAQAASADEDVLRRERMEELLENIARGYVDSEDTWVAMDMGAYELYAPDTEYALSSSARQKLINNSVDLADTDCGDTDMAKAILALTATGTDARSLYKSNDNEPIDMVDKLNHTSQSVSVWCAPYTLAAYAREEYTSRSNVSALIDGLLENQGSDGSWDEYGTIDTTANAISGLAFYRNDRELGDAVSDAINRGVGYLAEQQNDDGTYSDAYSGSNSNSTAMVVMALAAAGVDLEEDERFIKDGNTVLDGLLSFVTDDNEGIGYTDNSSASAYSTEQGFRAIIGAMGAISAGDAFNVYDFSQRELSPGRQAIGDYDNEGGGEDNGEEITVSVTIKTNRGYWLDRYSVAVSDSTPVVGDALINACNEKGIEQTGAENGYVSSMTYGGETLSEFGNGANSGWLYKVNGQTPRVGMNEYEIADGDSIMWYYTEDYTYESGGSSQEYDEVYEEYDKPYADVDRTIETVAEKLINTVSNPAPAQVGGEWAVIGLARSGAKVPDGYFDIYYKNLCETLAKKSGVLHDKKYTEYARAVLALSATGRNPYDCGGYNLIEKLCDYDKVIGQGINGPVFALLALDSSDKISKDTEAVRKRYLEYIVNAQNTDGGFPLSKGGESDIDVTAMALSAMSPYDDDKTAGAVKGAVGYLTKAMGDNGTFVANGVANAETGAQVLMALSSLGSDMCDTVLDGLLTFYLGENGFCHVKSDREYNLMATEQGLCALVAYKRLEDGKPGFYDMSDVSPRESIDVQKRGIARKLDVKYEGRTFSDIVGDSNRLQIEALAARDIINGKSDDIFEPDSTMTRAEFATVVVRGLGLDMVSEDVFGDVKGNDWFYSFVATAYKYGIINGVSDSEFNPYGVITKEEAAVMVARAGKLCGIEKIYDSVSVRNLLSAFTDYISVSDWAEGSMALCYDMGILDDSEIEIQPKRWVTRAEIAVMFYNLLDGADLL